MKDGILGIGVVVLILGGLFIFQRSVDAHHSWWVFCVEGVFVLIGFAEIHSIWDLGVSKDKPEEPKA